MTERPAARLKVYISGPLTNGASLDGDVRMANVRRAVDLFVTLADAGFAPFCPHLTEFVDRQRPDEVAYDVWMEIDMPWVASSDAVFRMPGDSSGGDMEVAQAHRTNVPVFYDLDSLREWQRFRMLDLDEVESCA